MRPQGVNPVLSAGFSSVFSISTFTGKLSQFFGGTFSQANRSIGPVPNRLPLLSTAFGIWYLDWGRPADVRPQPRFHNSFSADKLITAAEPVGSPGDVLIDFSKSKNLEMIIVRPVRERSDLSLKILQKWVESITGKGMEVKPSRFTEEQVIGILREQEAGAKTADVCREYSIGSATFYKWRAKYGGLEVSDAKRLKSLEDENAKLKKLLAEAMLDNAMPKQIATKKW